MSKPTITEFLEARIAEDEAVVAHPSPHEMLGGYTYADVGGLSDVLTVGVARVLAECAAKRAIMEEHAPVDFSGLGMESPNSCRLCGVDASMFDWEWAKDSFPCVTLQALAAVYASHPDYQPEWTPNA